MVDISDDSLVPMTGQIHFTTGTLFEHIMTYLRDDVRYVTWLCSHLPPALAFFFFFFKKNIINKLRSAKLINF